MIDKLSAKIGSLTKAQTATKGTAKLATRPFKAVLAASSPEGTASPDLATTGGPSRAAQALKATITDLEKQRKRVDRLIAQASAGRNFSPAELIALQANVYRYAQEMEIFSRVVDRTVSAAKTTLNTQV